MDKLPDRSVSDKIKSRDSFGKTDMSTVHLKQTMDSGLSYEPPDAVFISYLFKGT